MEGGRGKDRQVILVGQELFRLPPMWEGLGIQLRVSEHFLDLGVVKGAVNGGLDFFLGLGGGWAGQ